MELRYCPRCSQQRVSGMRFCGQCAFDFEAADEVLDEGAGVAAVGSAGEATPTTNVEAEPHDSVDGDDEPLDARIWEESNLLGSLGTPVQMRDGVDVLVTKSIDGPGKGISIWVQNPFGRVATVGVALTVLSKKGDYLKLVLEPLEVGVLIMPLQQTDDFDLAITAKVSGTGERVRSVVPSQVELGRTLLSVAGAVGSAFIVGIGRYSVHRRGGESEQPVNFNIKHNGEYWLAHGPVRYVRLYAPDRSREAALYYQKSDRDETEVIGLGLLLVWAMTGIVGLAALYGLAGVISRLLPASGLPWWVSLAWLIPWGIVTYLAYFWVSRFVVLRGWVTLVRKGSQLGEVEGFPSDALHG